jgi:2'-5' RNA ligase
MDQHMRVIRCFVALEIPFEVQELLGGVANELSRSGADVNWVRPGNIHLTLKFLGEIPQNKFIQAGMAVSRMKGRVGPIMARLGELGAFPVLDKPRVVWAGLSQGAEECGRAFQSIEEELAAIGFQREERRFSPHLTLGRVKSNRNAAELAGLIRGTRLPPEEFPFKALSLIKSSLSPQGPAYESVNSVYLDQ